MWWSTAPIPTFSAAALADLTTAWLLTYALHSTLLLGGVWLTSRFLSRRTLAMEETLWKLALVGGLLTASLQIGLGWEPLAGSWSLSSPAAVEAATPLAPSASGPSFAATAAAKRPSDPGRVAPERIGVPAAKVATGAGTEQPAPPLAAAAFEPPRWTTVISVAWLLGALLLAGSLAFSYLALCRRIRGRAWITGGTLRRLFDALDPRRVVGRPVRLSSSSRIPGPIAKGLRRPEICVPVRALGELSDEQQETLLAHELGHLARRDPAWLLAARGVESLLFFQPLNRLARRRLMEISELRADDWAVRTTGRPLDLARCLTRVAGWSLAPLPVPGISQGRSGLGRRIHRLLTASPHADRAPRGSTLLAAGVLAIVVLAAPGVSAAGRSEAPEAPPAPEAPAAPSTAEAPPAPQAPPAPAAAAEPSTAEAPPAPLTPPAVRPVPEAPSAPPAPPAPAPRPAFHLAAAPRPAPAPRASQAPGEPSEVEAEIHEALETEIEHGLEGLELEMDAIDAELEAALQPLADLGEEIESQLNESGFEAFHEEIERSLEPLQREIEALAKDYERLSEEGGRDPAELGQMATRIGALAGEIGSQMGAFAQQWVGPMTAHLAEIQPLIERAVPSQEQLARLSEQAARIAEEAQPDAEELAHLKQEAQRLAQEEHPDPEELERLKAEARRLAERARPDEAEIARLKEEARRLAEEMRPNAEEMARIREEARRIAQEARPGAEQMRQMRQQMVELREKLRAQMEELRRELEVQREQLREQNEELRREEDRIHRERPDGRR